MSPGEKMTLLEKINRAIRFILVVVGVGVVVAVVYGVLKWGSGY